MAGAVSAAPGRMRGRTGLALAAITALAAALRFVDLGHQSFWFDEKITVDLMHVSWSTLLRTLPHSESTPPLYYLAALAWSKLFGVSEVGLRSLSAVAGTLTVPAAYGTGAALVSRRTGLIAAALVAVNPFLVWYSQEARAYAVAVLFSVLALLYFARAITGARARAVDLALWALSSTLALATHYFAIFLIAPMGLWLAWRARPRRSALIACGAIVIAIAALAPLVLSQQANGRATWISHIALGLRLRQLAQQYLIGFDAPARLALLFVSLALVATAVGLLALRGGERERRGAALCAGLAVSGLLLPLLFTAAGDDFLISRNTIPVLVPLLVAGACAFGATRTGLLGLAASGALCVVGVVAVVAVDRDRSLQRPDWRGLAAALGPARQARAVVVPGGYRSQPLRLYLHNSDYFTARSLAVSEIDVVAARSPRHRACWWGAACNLPSLAISTSPPLRGFVFAGRRDDGLFTVLRFQAPRVVPVTPGELQAAVPTLPKYPRVLVYVQRA